MSEPVFLKGDVEEAGGLLHICTGPGSGVIAFDPKEVSRHDDGLSIPIGSTAIIVEPPEGSPEGETERASHIAGIEATQITSVACIGGIPSLHITGVLIDCKTGKVLGPCYQAFPCN